MLEFLFPRLYCGSVYDIDYEALLQARRTALLFDIDNTLEPFDVPEPSRRLAEHLGDLRRRGFLICLISNNKEERVARFNQDLGFPYVYKARKPGKKGLRKALAHLGRQAEQAVLIGDQIFTDVWCGNRCGLFTILVKPVATRDEWSVRLKRGLEKKVLERYLKTRTYTE